MYGTQILLVILGGVWGTIFIVYVILPTLYPLDLVSMMQVNILFFYATFYDNFGISYMSFNFQHFKTDHLISPAIPQQ